MKLVGFILSVLLFHLGCTSCAVAQTADLPVQPYHSARIIFQSKAETDEYLLALSSYKKIAGSWRVDRQQRLSGVLERYTLELPENHNAENGFDYYLDQLRNFNMRELFYCAGRDCGTSNSWANNHFKIQLLYGLDQFQYYGAYEVTTADEKPFYVSLYAVRRGNKRVLMQVDILHVDKVIELGVASSPQSIIKSLNDSGYYVFPDVVIQDAKKNTAMQIKQVHLQALIDALTQQQEWHIAVVGHDYVTATITQQQAQSLEYAEQLKEALQKKGVAAARIRTYGIGSLAPAGRGDRSARVEIVKLTE